MCFEITWPQLLELDRICDCLSSVEKWPYTLQRSELHCNLQFYRRIWKWSNSNTNLVCQYWTSKEVCSHNDLHMDPVRFLFFFLSKTQSRLLHQLFRFADSCDEKPSECLGQFQFCLQTWTLHESAWWHLVDRIGSYTGGGQSWFFALPFWILFTKHVWKQVLWFFIVTILFLCLCLRFGVLKCEL